MNLHIMGYDKVPNLAERNKHKPKINQFSVKNKHCWSSIFYLVHL